MSSYISGGSLQVANRLSEIAALGAAAQLSARTNLGVGTGDSPTFAALTLTGADGITLPAGGRITGAAGNITLTPSGTGLLAVTNAGTTGQELATFLQAGQTDNTEVSLRLGRNTVDGYGSTILTHHRISTSNNSNYFQIALQGGNSIARFIGNGNVLLKETTDNGVDTLQVTGSALFSTTIKTGAPSGSAGVWKLGKVVAGAVALDAANYVETLIDGAVVKLLKAA